MPETPRAVLALGRTMVQRGHLNVGVDTNLKEAPPTPIATLYQIFLVLRFKDNGIFVPNHYK